MEISWVVMTSMPPPIFSKIAMLGSGAIGSYYGARLAKIGLDVHFVARSDAAVLNEKGIEVQLPDQRISVYPIRAYTDSKEIGPCDLVIVALKAMR